MMQCGHAANATKEGKPCCAICAGLVAGSDIVALTPNLVGRKAKCSLCGKIADSSTELAFFEYLPKKEYDIYYDGCLGWD